MPIPQALKRSLTTMQIIQFLVGGSYAALHSFISYVVPVQVPNMETSVQNIAAVTSSVATAVSSPGVRDALKKYLFRAAGEEGLAENVYGTDSPDQLEQLMSANNGLHQAEQYHTEYQTIPCINTSGQTFAIWLNVLYLTPLTFLFVRFFVKSYLRRTGQKSGKGTGHATKLGAVETAGINSFKGVDRETHENGGMNGKQNGKH